MYPRDLSKKVWELNSATRRAKMSTTTSEVTPVVTSKSSEVYHWGGGKLTPQKHELFAKGRSALQVGQSKIEGRTAKFKVFFVPVITSVVRKI